MPFDFSIFENVSDDELEELRRRPVRAGTPIPMHGKRQDLSEHLQTLAREFSGRTHLELYHVYLTVRIRRSIEREDSVARFLAMWRGHGQFLLTVLDSRWLISACDTIADYGDQEDRALALSGVLLMNTIKLYETERLLRSPSPVAPDRSNRNLREPLFDGLTKFKIGRGDLIINMLRRLERVVEASASFSIAAPILSEIVRRSLLHDTVFRRFADVHERELTRWRPLRQRKIAIINDTSSSLHYGSEAVMSSINSICSQANLAISHRQPAGRDWRSDEAAIRAIDDADIVIVNGEGYIQKGTAQAKMLSSIGPYCRSRGKPAYLLNASVQDNPPEILHDLRDFDHIWVRESRSGFELADSGIAYSVCGDLSLLKEFEGGGAILGNTIVVDTILKGRPQQYLARVAIDERAPFITMFRDDEGFSRGSNWTDIDPEDQASIGKALMRPLL